MKNPQYFKYGKEFIASMEELIVRYKEAKKQQISKWDYESSNRLKCLLCHPIGLDVNRDTCRTKLLNSSRWYVSTQESCAELGCPWMVITGTYCDAQPTRAYNNYNPDVINRRIKQLRNWIKIYKKHMEN